MLRVQSERVDVGQISGHTGYYLCCYFVINLVKPTLLIFGHMCTNIRFYVHEIL